MKTKAIFSREQLPTIPPLQTGLFNSLKKEKKPSKPFYTQNLIGLNEVYDGFFFMNTGQVIGIIEIYAIDFNKRSPVEQTAIIDKFEALFRVAPSSNHLKMKTQKTDISEIINHIKEANLREKDSRVINQINDYIETILNIQGKDTYCKKFYHIFEYEGDAGGRKSRNKDEIAQQMREIKIDLLSRYRQIGNTVAIPYTPREVLTQPMEIVYGHLNPKSSQEETFESRYTRLLSDEAAYNNTHSQARQVKDGDYIAPRGIYLHPKAKDTVIIDGVYHTYLIINDDAYPEGTPGVLPGWIANLLANIEDIDIDIVIKKLPHDSTLELLRQNKKLTISRASAKANNPDKFQELSQKEKALHQVIERMSQNDEDLYNVMIIITIRADSMEKLYLRKNTIIKNLKEPSIYVSQAHRIRIPLMQMTMPFMHIDGQLFNKFSHNFLTSALASFYWYSAYEIMDDQGLVMGINLENGTLFAFNNFLRKKYVNPHMVLLGTSGAGKTFTQQMMGYRMRMSGMKCIFVIPSKASLDYKPGCENINGSFIKLGPLQEACINIMQIRPEEVLKTENVPLLAKKITVVTTFIQLLLGKEELTSSEIAALNVALEDLYRSFGITQENDSIYIPGTNQVKPMPIIEDLRNSIKGNPQLRRVTEVLHPFVEGSCKNMNGQTNVNLENDYIVFDVDEDTISKYYFPAFLYIAFDCAYSIAKRSVKEYVAVILDEVWKLMKNRLSAEQVQAMIKLLRAYNSCVILGTQDIKDFLGAPDDFGKKILSNAAIKLVLRLLEDEAEDVGEHLKLSEADKAAIQRFETGDCMFISNGNKTRCFLKASAREIEVFTPKGE